MTDPTPAPLDVAALRRAIAMNDSDGLGDEQDIVLVRVDQARLWLAALKEREELTNGRVGLRAALNVALERAERLEAALRDIASGRPASHKLVRALVGSAREALAAERKCPICGAEPGIPCHQMGMFGPSGTHHQRAPYRLAGAPAEEGQ